MGKTTVDLRFAQHPWESAILDGMGTRDAVARWNHNIHYHSVVLEAVPSGARTALDVGTGDGLLARDLRRTVPRVVGLDVDAAVLARAQADGGDQIEWLEGDVFAVPLASGSFDVVASIATLHHFPDLQEALRRLADLAAPGGVVVVIGLARSAGPVDFLHDVLGVLRHWGLTRRRAVWKHSAPIVWPPPHTYSEVRDVAARPLPGARWRRLALWRYALVWTKPA